MPKFSSQFSKPSQAQQRLDQEDFTRLQADTRYPYRGLRQFVYFVCGTSGALGAFLFLMQLIDGQGIEAALPNLGLEIGIVALMIWLFRREQRPKR
jgi:hypothetical protein